jgi:endonuclease/exonuclease/phosphatase (EEP) superfamily protein YafD
MTAPPDRLAPASSPPHGAPPPTRRPWVLPYVAALLFTLVLAVFVLPDLLFGLDRQSPFAQLVSMRPWLLVGVAALLVMLVVVFVFERRMLPFVAGVLAVLLIGGGVVLPRLVPDPVPAGGRPFTVLAFNTYEGSADLEQVAALIEQHHPDVVALSEAGQRYADRLGPLVEPRGYTLHSSVGERSRDVGGVTTVVSNQLGDVQVRIGKETSSFPYLELSGGGLGDLRMVAFHSVAPVPGAVPDWQHDLALLGQWCSGPTPAIVAGDFNATIDHSPLRAGTAGCGDAASQRGEGLVPTWGPSPRIREEFGPQIDHVFATDGIVAETFEVHDISGSDHRAVLTTLRLPG